MSIREMLMNKKYTVIFTTILLGILSFKMLFFGPIIGMADNGDFFREINNAGLYYTTDNYEDRHFGYFNRIYGVRQYPYEKNTVFVSSLSLLIRGTVAFDRYFISKSVFDIRILAFIYITLFLFAFYKVLTLFTKNLKIPAAIPAFISLVVFGDVGYIAYFNSFYGEPASFVFLFVMFAFIFNLIEKERPSIVDFILFLLSALFFIGAKQQNSPGGFLIAILLARILFIRKDTVWRITTALSLVLVVAWSLFLFTSMSDDIKHINQYHAVTRGILLGSQNPEKDLDDFGLDEKFSLLQGTTYYDRFTLEPTESELMNRDFYSKYGYASIIKYYLMHTDRLADKLNLTVKNAFAIRPEVLGNYEKSEEKGYGAKTHFFSFWSSLKKTAFPKTLRYFILFIALYYAVLIKLYVGYYRKKCIRGMIKIEVFAVAALIGLSQFGVSFIGAGDADLAKHLFLFNVCFDFMFVAGIIFIADKLARKSGI